MLLSPVMGCWWAGGAHSPGNKDTTISIASPRHPNTHRRIFWLSCKDLSTSFTEMSDFYPLCLCPFLIFGLLPVSSIFLPIPVFWLFLLTSDSWTRIGHILSYGRIVCEYCNPASGPRSSQQLLLFRVS